MNPPPILRWLLWPLSLLYGIAVRLRLWLYARGTFETERLRTPVISVGNLTVGERARRHGYLAGGTISGGR